MKIYTRTGDDGTTGLIGGKRVPKHDLRIECYGTVDELNAAIGLAATGAADELLASLRRVQNELFVIGSHLANDSVPAASNLPALQADSISRMEMEIDRSQSVLRPLKQFILPGGTETASRLHLARAIARRAERLTVRLRADSSIDQHILTYLNRLSDWLFVQARLANHVAGVEDRPWEK